MPSKRKSGDNGRSIGLADYPSPVMSSADKKAQRRMSAEEALRTLTRAEEHRADPRVMRDVRRLAAEHASRLSRIAKR